MLPHQLSTIHFLLVREKARLLRNGRRFGNHRRLICRTGALLPGSPNLYLVHDLARHTSCGGHKYKICNTLDQTCRLPQGPDAHGEGVAHASEQLDGIVAANDLVVDGVHAEIVLVHDEEARRRHAPAGAAARLEEEHHVRAALHARIEAGDAGTREVVLAAAVALRPVFLGAVIVRERTGSQLIQRAGHAYGCVAAIARLLPRRLIQGNVELLDVGVVILVLEIIRFQVVGRFLTEAAAAGHPRTRRHALSSRSEKCQQHRALSFHGQLPVCVLEPTFFDALAGLVEGGEVISYYRKDLLELI